MNTCSTTELQYKRYHRNYADHSIPLSLRNSLHTCPQNRIESLKPIISKKSSTALNSDRWHICAHQCRLIYSEGGAPGNSRGHVLDDAVEQVEPLVVVSLGSKELLEHPQQTWL